MQIFIYCKVTVHVSGVTAPIIRSIKNCTRSLRYRSYYLYCYSPHSWSERRLRVQFLILLMMGAVTPETCRVVLQWINICILLDLLDFLFTILCQMTNTLISGVGYSDGRTIELVSYTCFKPLCFITHTVELQFQHVLSILNLLIQSVFSLTLGPRSLPKRILHTVRCMLPLLLPVSCL